VNKLLLYEELDPSTRRPWINPNKQNGIAAVPVVGREKDELVQAGHEAIPSKRVDVDI